jgi:formate-nitrite transporter family protein
MATLAIPLSVHDHVRGRLDAPLTLVQYGDFQCSHCARVYPMVLEIAEDLGDSLAFALRHFPLPQVHPLAQLTAEAAEAAASQGRFWEMATVLYENQEEMDDDRLTRCAQKADLDIKRFKKEIKSGIHASRVRADYLGGVRSGMKGTPTFFINGQLYEGAHESAALVAELLKASRGR